VDAQKKRQADQLLPRARSAGARFGQMARQFSEDPGSRVQGGALGVAGRGQFVQVFEDAAWALGPGDVSPVVKSPFGYHIIRRPPLAEVRDSFRTGVEDRALIRADSMYVDSLSVARKITPVKKAAAIVRGAQDLDAARTNNQTVVKYRGGAFRVKDVARWLSALDPQVLQALPQATDEQINQFLRVVVQRQLLIEQADSAGTALTPEEVQVVRTQHDSTITILASVLNVTPSALGDSASTPEAQRRIARARVEDYLERVVQGRARFFPLPPFLAETLRNRGASSVNQSGVRRAVERAREVRAAVDSVPAPGQAPPPSGGGRPQLRPNTPADTTRSR
jgi:peptidyl-prolyl cis-trans isomerase D